MTPTSREPRHPIYIVSKGRWESRLTHKWLCRMKVPHSIVVEPQEREAYERVINREWCTVLTLDMTYKERYEVCDEFGLTRSPGSGAARNFAWEHSIARGAKWHWLMDDNIDGFYRLNHNLKTPCNSGAIFAAMEDFCGRYDNVTMGGPNYFMFASRKSVMPAFVANTRIFSCNLIRNDAPYRWRARYNEDLDLSLRMLKDGNCTILFNAFLQYKAPTQTIKGGNEELYKFGTKAKSEMIERLHPDVARVTFKFNRWHHEVNYGPFKANRLRERADLPAFAGVDNYGMILEQKILGIWTRVDKPRFEKRKAHYAMEKTA
jgi:hypothetical protein